jgi:hypothetical protein
MIFQMSTSAGVQSKYQSAFLAASTASSLLMPPRQDGRGRSGAPRQGLNALESDDGWFTTVPCLERTLHVLQLPACQCRSCTVCYIFGLYNNFLCLLCVLSVNEDADPRFHLNIPDGAVEVAAAAAAECRSARTGRANDKIKLALPALHRPFLRCHTCPPRPLLRVFAHTKDLSDLLDLPPQFDPTSQCSSGAAERMGSRRAPNGCLQRQGRLKTPSSFFLWRHVNGRTPT